MLISNGCKCSNAKEPFRILETVQPTGVPIIHDLEDQLELDAAVAPIMHDLEDHLELAIGCESHDINDSMTLVQFDIEGSEVGCHLDCLESKENAGSVSELLNLFKAEDFFTKDNDWPPASQDFLINEHNDRTGLKGIIFRAIIDHTRKSGFDRLSDAEMYFHLLSTIIHYNSSRSESINICSMLEHTSLDSDELLKSTKNAFFQSLEKQLIFAMTPILPESVMQGIIQRVLPGVRNDLEVHQMKMPQSPRVTIYKEVRSKYLDGSKSILRNLPMPTPSIKTLFAGTEKETSFAHITANQILNHVLALGYDCYFYRAGFEEDWAAGENGTCSLINDDEYCCEFLKEAHSYVKEMMTNNPSIPKDTRVVTLRVWSDSFEAHNVKGNIQFNSLQVITVKLRGPKDQTLPYALCFKTCNVRKILVLLLEELFELREVTMRYWGKDKRIIPTVALLELVSNDYPERCFNTAISQNGTYTKRFGHSFMYDKVTTPSCAQCQIQRMEILLDESRNASIGPCENCSDWWSNVERGNKYPIPPGGDITKVGMVELSFELITNSLKDLQIWYSENKGQGGASKYAKKYMQVLGLGAGLIDEIMKTMRTGQPVVECDSYPEIFKGFKDLHIELNMFPSMPMHLCFLGVEKSLIDQTKNIILNGKITAQGTFWRKLTQPMRQRQQALNKVSIDWCLPMPFSGEGKNDIGHGNWQSDHCLAFTRISLFQLADLDGDTSGVFYPTQLNRVIASLRRMRVVWFCLVSNMFCDVGFTSTNRVDHLIRMFLSSCKDFSEHSKEAGCSPFYADQSNIFSLLNCPSIIKRYGSLPGIWEGEDEAFVKCVKAEISTMRYRTSHLLSLLVKLLQTKTLNHLNQSNPFDKCKAYGRTNNVRIYARGRNCQDPSMILDQEIFVSGFVDDSDDLFVCFEEISGKGIKLFPVIFHDNIGEWRLNMWYAAAALSPHHISVRDRSELKEICQDYFLMLRHGKESNLWTAVFRSWRVRNDTGMLALPCPQKRILTLEDCLS